MKKWLEKIFKKRYLILLIVIVGLSYGQILGMDVWKDDNAIFFKFNHINEQTGYLGTGIFGDGTYRFTVTPYYFIYQLFGNKNIWPYHLLTLVTFFASCLVVCQLFSQLINKNIGRVAGLLYGAGYVASEGVIWLASSMIQSVSILLVCATLIFLDQYAKNRRLRSLILAMIGYLVALLAVPVRTHYFILVIILFDFLWVVRFNIRSVIAFLARLTIYFTVFYMLFIYHGDFRVGTSTGVIKELVSGHWRVILTFLGNFGRVFIPDQQVLSVAKWNLNIGLEIASVGVISWLVWKVFRMTRLFKIVFPVFLILSFGLMIFLEVADLENKFLLYGADRLAIFGGGLVLMTIVSVLILIDRSHKRLIIFLLLWLSSNVAIYTGYLPSTILATNDRYLAHSVVPMVGLVVCLGLYRSKDLVRKILVGVVTLVLVLNVVNSVIYQHQFIVLKSIPTREFYVQLKNYLPAIAKGDLIYFDVADSAIYKFESAFSVGQMPNETAIAWRYGVDRYDFKMLTDFDQLIVAIKNQRVGLNKVHTYFYSNKGLEDTTSQFNKLLGSDAPVDIDNDQPNFSNIRLNRQALGTFGSNEDLDFKLLKPIKSIIPLEIDLELVAKPMDFAPDSFPYQQNNVSEPSAIWRDSKLRSLAFDYQKEKLVQRNLIDYSVSSQWREHTKANLKSSELESYWQADRIRWRSRQESLTADLISVMDINHVVWVNGLDLNSPKDYSIEVSKDGQSWEKVQQINGLKRLGTNQLRVESFPTHQARWVKMIITDTFSGDSPNISKFWVVPDRFSDLKIEEAEKFLAEPFSYLPDQSSLSDSLTALEQTGTGTIFWRSNKTSGWQTSPTSKIKLIYDGLDHHYRVLLPASGTEITDLKLGEIIVPSQLERWRISARYPKLY